MTVNLKQLLASSKFIPIYAERIHHYMSGLPPVAVEIHWTSTCNYNCVHCSYGKRRKAQDTLPQNIIQSLTSDLINLKTQAVYLSGGGEPTTMSTWADYAQELVDNGVEVALVTNGVAIQERHADVVRKMNYIAISVYSTEQSEYNKITGSNSFEKQFTLPSLIKKNKSSVIVGARCVLNKVNFRRTHHIYRKAIESGFDYIIFIPAVDYEESGVGLGADEIACIKHILTDNLNDFDSARTNIDHLLKRNINHYETNDYRNSFVERPAYCSAVRIRGNAFINFDGKVYLCQPHIDNAAYAIGNLHESTFREIWNSPRHIKVVDDLNRNFSKGLCRNCRSINFNIAADSYDHKRMELVPCSKDPFI